MKQLQHFQDAIQQMHDEGITKKTLRDEYHLTEWGARKFADVLGDREEEINGRGKKRFYTDHTPSSLPKNLKSEPMPVKTNNTEIVRQPQHEKQSETNDVKEYLDGLEKMVKSVEPPEIEFNDHETTEGGIDVIWHETDTHIGALVEDSENGEVVFNTEKAKEIMQEKRHNFKDYIEHLWLDRVEDIDNIHWVLGGDIVEGTGIYGGQAHETDSYINKQIEEAGEELVTTYKFLYELASHIDAQLQIVCMPGNHGDMKISSASNKASFDDIIYHNLHQAIGMHQDTIEDDGVEVRVKRSDTYVGTTFPLRNMTAYVTHGQHMKDHVGTSSGQRDALSIMHEKDADVIFRGHYHMPKIEDVNGTPVVMTNSIKPGGMYEDSIQAYGNPGYAFYTASDGNPVKDVKFYSV